MSFDENYCKQIVRSFLNQNRLETNNSSIHVILKNDVIMSDDLGVFICSLSNYGAYHEIPYVYVLWGISEDGKSVVGTDYVPPEAKEQEKELAIKPVYSLIRTSYENLPVVVLEVQSAVNTSMQFKGVEYFLDKNFNPVKLNDLPEIEKKLWEILDKKESFEMRSAKNNVSILDILELLDCKKLFEMMSIPYPNNPAEIISKLIELRFIIEKNTGKFSITNLGALLVSKRITSFPSVEYKAVRVLKYSGADVSCPAKEQIGGKGYIIGFSGLIDYIMGCLPTIETIDGAIRREISVIPILSVRELVANAMIHQDLNESGAPTVSIFSDRIEITNPGVPLIKNDRFIDHPPVSRNESLVAAMRKVGICEERGSGYDKIVSSLEKNNQPAPIITTFERSTKVCLYVKKGFDSLSKKERVAACYAHVCLNYVRNEPSNNTTLRTRFQLDENERYKVSRVFSETCEAGLILPQEGTGMKNREYVPYWASIE